MTNVGLLSTRFESLTETLRAFNDSVIALKKNLYRMPGFDKIAGQEIATHVIKIKTFLEKSLSVLEKPNAHLNEDDIAAQIVAEGLRENRMGDLDDLLEELKQTIQQLESNWKNLAEDDVFLLDSICWLIDSEASLTFRRIWKR